ncbi:hypothetical protein BDN72DRAFT_899850 [Pluteus cervinus]|uniref:Uncharacterized protein n=1 Tax=Pluteus cervinus TaxID=181527 RepID=A0ACD3AMI2_9AGAR|nr:hypothetical protein BDN72DRAFT_899850 [Pluteus cervinus]
MDLEVKDEVFCLLGLPAEVIDDILGHVPLHRDLLNFALASRSCSSLAIPRHTEYRVVHFPYGDMDPTWTHLSRRTDLAIGIREIHILFEAAPIPDEYHSRPAFHFPNRFFDPDLDLKDKDLRLQEEIFKALSSMAKLKKVHWNWVPQRSIHLIPKVLEVLKTIPTFQHFSFNYSKEFGTDDDDIAMTSRIIHGYVLFRWRSPCSKISRCEQLWEIPNLESLSLEGSTWTSLSRITKGRSLMLKWLQSLWSLQFLRMDVKPFLTYCDDLTFPCLRGLDVRNEAVFDDQVINFLQRHPGIEELVIPLRTIPKIQRDFLPNLRRLSCQPDALYSLEANSNRWDSTGNPNWRLEYLHLPHSWYGNSIYGDKNLVNALCGLTFFDHTTLRVLSIHPPGSASAFIQLAKSFPMIEEIRLSSRASTCTFPDMLQVFSHFSNLRIIHGDSIWIDFSFDGFLDMVIEDSKCPEKNPPSPNDPKTDFALNACTDPENMLFGKLYDEEGRWTINTEVNHRILALARRCKKLERLDSYLEKEVVYIRRKKVNWEKVKPMADWLRVENEQVRSEWEEIEYSMEARCSR